MRRIARLTALGCALAAAGAAAAPFGVQLGSVRLVLDAPAGFTDAGFTGSPRIQELAEALTPAVNRVLLFALSDGDLRRFSVGDPPELRRYVIAVTPRALERDQIGLRDYERLLADTLREAGEVMPPTQDIFRHLDEGAPGRPRLLAALRRDADVLSIMHGQRLPPESAEDKTPHYLLNTTTLFRLRGKVISLSLYAHYDSPADVEWLRYTTARWMADLQRLNR